MDGWDTRTNCNWWSHFAVSSMTSAVMVHTQTYVKPWLLLRMIFTVSSRSAARYLTASRPIARALTPAGMSKLHLLVMMSTPGLFLYQQKYDFLFTDTQFTEVPENSHYYLWSPTEVFFNIPIDIVELVFDLASSLLLTFSDVTVTSMQWILLIE